VSVDVTSLDDEVIDHDYLRACELSISGRDVIWILTAQIGEMKTL